VEELLGFVPSGEGEHCLVRIEKRGRNTNDVATDLAKKLGIRKRLVSHCGLKDKQAVTRQWFSLHLPGQPSPESKDLDIDGVRVLEITRNLRKLHRGTHAGNRFTIRLRHCAFSQEAAAVRWQHVTERGVPNYFGAQRFGSNGDNVEMALRFMSGEKEVNDRLLRGILISAARSFLFNACVEERVKRGNWDQALEGEVYGFADNRSLVLPENTRGDEAERVVDGSLELTAPLWGIGDLHSQGLVKSIEEEVVGRYADVVAGLAQFNLRQERRVIRLKPAEPMLNWESDSTLVVSFALPKGTFATTLLRELADFV
jgi:tRNA pseudouridine13 synthase